MEKYPPLASVLAAEEISKSFFINKKKTTIQALKSVSFAVQAGGVSALVGPDGAGKTTMLRIIAGLLSFDSGSLVIFGRSADKAGPELRQKIGYMPQKFGLYEDLTVQENLDLYADLRGLAKEGREERYKELLVMTALEPFRTRLAGKLSGGMKQKLGLICTLVQPPELLLLDEPTVGVDPLSRRELWQIIEILTTRSGMSVVVSTSYLDEAAKCDEVVLLHEGAMLARGTPKKITEMADGMSYIAKPPQGEAPRSLQARLFSAAGVIDAVPQGGEVRLVHAALASEQKKKLQELLSGAETRPVAASLEDSFMLLLNKYVDKTGEEVQEETTPATSAPPAFYSAAPSEKISSTEEQKKGEPVIETRNVSRLFGDFIAVNNISFSVYKGEVFGLLGPNGAGKTTTFKMLCGLLPASKGTLRIAGVDVTKAREEARRHLGYVAQKFSLYSPLTVRENLEFFSGAYGLRGEIQTRRMREVARDFSLEGCMDMPAGDLPGGYKQRLAMAVGLLHEPSILFLDEATSGADPLARREFWQRISFLAQQGVTIIVTTHFMEEAEYCDRVLIQSDGIMLALDTPANIRAEAKSASCPSPTMEEAFIAIVESGRKKNGQVEHAGT